MTRNPSGKLARAQRNDLAQRMLHFIRSRKMLHPGERVGVAVSGGADSVALLLLLLELGEQLGLVLTVVHFNHKLRGKASEADEKFVAKLAAQHGLEFISTHEDIAAKAKRERANLEDAARRARYGFFERLAKAGRVHRIAVAHTADDQAETVLAHVLRGTGLAGLSGIHPEAGAVFRPLLEVRRADLRAFLRAKGQHWREDVTNRDTKRTRARIRQRLMPLLEKEFQPAVVKHLCRLAELAREDETYLERQAERLEANISERMQDEVRVRLVDLFGNNYTKTTGESAEKFVNRAMCARLIRRIVQSIKPRGGQLSAEHVEAALRLAECSDSGKSLCLPGGVEVRRERDALRFRPAAGLGKSAQPAVPPAKPYSYEVKLETPKVDLPILELSTVLRFRVIDWSREGRETSITGAVLDGDRLLLPLMVRNWQPGDAMRPCGHQRRHKLARLLNEMGVSRWEKRTWPIVTSGGKAVWARGLPVAAEFAASNDTRLGVTITEERES